MKVRRSGVYEKYATIIESMYIMTHEKRQSHVGYGLNIPNPEVFEKRRRSSGAHAIHAHAHGHGHHDRRQSKQD